MIEGRSCACFEPKARRGLAVLPNLLWKELQRDESTESDVLGLENLAHTTATEQRYQAVVAEVRRQIGRGSLCGRSRVRVVVYKGRVSYW
jgi:hypothetical protein